MGSLVFDQIKLVGFKSFVDPTDFVIQPGLTGVVGPNGCGKSNLLEAIRWVMGANSAKAMRAKGMDDVIFNGTNSRPGRNQAHVTLTVDNRARIAPSVFNDNDTLEVTRIITKGKGSKYQVNGQTVRLKDIQLLFADASTGANSPALVRQGQINELIAAKPSNRRRILEEAAGISGLHTRRHEAELRLRAAETNLSRLDDIVAQIESQLTSLRRQSRQATRYKRLAGEINEFKALLWLKRWELALETLSASQEALKVCGSRVEDTAKTASELTRKAAELAETLDPKREEQIIAAAVLARLNAAKEQLELDENTAKSEVTKLEARLEQIRSDLARETAIIEDASTATTRLDIEFEALSKLKDISAALDAAEDEAKLALSARTNVETQFNLLMRKDAEVTARYEAAERDVASLSYRLEKFGSEETEAKDKLASLMNKGQAGGGENLFVAAAQDALGELETARINEQNLITARQSAESADQDARETLSETRQSLTKLEAEKSALENVLKRGSKAEWVPALSKIEVEKGFEQALAVAMGEDVNAAIAEAAPIRWLGAQAPTQSLPGGIKALLDYVKAPHELEARLSQIGIASEADIDRLKDQLNPGQCLVTKTGRLMRWDGLEVDAGAETSAAIRLAQQTRLTELEIEIATGVKAVETTKTAFETARQKRQLAEQATRDARKTLSEIERKERAAQAALTQYQTDMAHENAQKTATQERLSRLEREITELKNQHADATKTLETLDTGESLSGELSALENKLSEAREKADETNATWRSLKNESEARAERLSAVETERQNWASRSATAKERVTTLQGRLDAANIAHQAATNGPDQFEERRQKLFSELEAAEARRSNAADTLATAEALLKSAEEEARQAEGAHSQAREQRAAAEARLTAAQERITETQARIGETLSCEPSELSSHLGELSPESNLGETDIERKLERLQKERERMGGVNLRADVEAEEQEERLVAMNEERTDLLAAIARLREGIDELNSEGRERLLKAFDIVNGHFGQLFTTLFGGGEAAIALTESDDPLEAGLEVMARPPGKKLGQMSLMSGGEQALTATALIFAVFLSNPAPICVLDEVDAPLDDANVARYCNLLDEMTRQTKTKFIAITHNAVTMSRMDRLFGVTMAEQGVSQLISMELERAAKLVAE